MDILFVCEIIGTVAFSISGALIAVNRGMDIFGIVVISVVTALGGGFMRDVILNITPPSMFENTIYVAIAVATGCYCFGMIRANRDIIPLISERYFAFLLNFTDAIGLGMFTVTGVNTALNYGSEPYMLFTIFLGVLTGVGGGVLRDVLVGETPVIFVRNIYASASLVGASLYYWLHIHCYHEYAILICSLLIIAIRVSAHIWDWNLPKAVN